MKNIFRRIVTIYLTCLILQCGGCLHLQAQPNATAYAETIFVNGRDVQEVIDEAPPYSTVVGDDVERIIETDGTIIINKPLRLTNFRGRLAPGATNTLIIQVVSQHVIVDNFRLFGNRGTVDFYDRKSLLSIEASNFLVENGRLYDSMKHGVVVRSKQSDTENGIIRNIVSHDVLRDAISLTGYGDLGFFNRNILVENISAYGSNDRGAVEVADGNENITVRNIYTDSCRYGVEIQDHSREGQVNTGILIEGVYTTNTSSAISMSISDFGHSNITIRDITGGNWPHQQKNRFSNRSPIGIRNVKNVILENVHMNDNHDRAAISIRDSNGIMVRNVFIENHGNEKRPAIQITDASNLLIDGVNLHGYGEIQAVVNYHLSGDTNHRNVQIRGISATKDLPTGIVLERLSGDATLTNYTITDNLVRIVDRIKGSDAYVEGNTP